MTTNDSFDRRLATWLDGEAEGRVPDHLSEVLVTTRATHQRPGWSSLERWLPVTSIATARIAMPRPVLPILFIVAVLVAALAAALVLQTGHAKIPPLGGAANGRIVYVDGTAIRSAAADGTDPQTIATLSDHPGEPAISPDGQLMAYTAEGSRIEIIGLAPSGHPPVVITAPSMSAYATPAWSPSADQIAFLASDGQSNHVFVSDADGRNVHEVAAGMVGPGHVVNWASFSPDGRSVAFAEAAQNAPGRLIIVAPDGSGAHALTSNLVEMGNGGGVSWSPDPATPRLLYLAYGGPTYYHDMATNKDVYVDIGFWPSWSPTGDRIAFWSNGTKVIATPASDAGARTPIEMFPSFSGNCADHPELAGKALCGPVTWSPDGTRVIATEITGNGLLSLRSDGSGDPKFLDLAANIDGGAGGVVAWQPTLKSR